MIVTPDSIWQVPAYLPYLQPHLTDEAIATAERQIGYPLPAEYLALLEKQNGGYIRFGLVDTCHALIAGIGPNFPAITDYKLDDAQDCVSFPLLGLVPFDGDGHWYLCLDYRQSSKLPAVSYIDIETDFQKPIAPTFTTYLSQLVLETDDFYVLASVPDVNKLIAQLSDKTGVRFTDPDTYAHGYPVYRATLETGEGHQNLWISPNQVQRGFVREDDPRYAELKELLPGYALRYPEIPKEAYICCCSAFVFESVSSALQEYCESAYPLQERITGR